MFRVDIRKGFFTVRMVKHWNRFLGKIFFSFPLAPLYKNGSLPMSEDECHLPKGWKHSPACCRLMAGRTFWEVFGRRQCPRSLAVHQSHHSNNKGKCCTQVVSKGKWIVGSSCSKYLNSFSWIQLLCSKSTCVFSVPWPRLLAVQTFMFERAHLGFVPCGKKTVFWNKTTENEEDKVDIWRQYLDWCSGHETNFNFLPQNGL